MKTVFALVSTLSLSVNAFAATTPKPLIQCESMGSSISLSYSFDTNARGGTYLIISGSGVANKTKVNVRLQALGIDRLGKANRKSVLDFWTDGAASEGSEIQLTGSFGTETLPSSTMSLIVDRMFENHKVILEGYVPDAHGATNAFMFSGCYSLNYTNELVAFENK